MWISWETLTSSRLSGALRDGWPTDELSMVVISRSSPEVSTLDFCPVDLQWRVTCWWTALRCFSPANLLQLKVLLLWLFLFHYLTCRKYLFCACYILHITFDILCKTSRNQPRTIRSEFVWENGKMNFNILSLLICNTAVHVQLCYLEQMHFLV